MRSFLALGRVQLSPGIGGHLDPVMLCGHLDVRECLFPLFIGGIAHLVEAGDGIPEVADVAERFLSLLREGEGELTLPPTQTPAKDGVRTCP